MNSLIMLGEDHQDATQISIIATEIKRLKPDFLLHELLYSDVALTSDVIAKRLQNCKEGGICDPRLNKDIYQLGYDNNIALVGIDLDKKLTGSDQEKFRLREEHMVAVIAKYRTKGNVIVVVGDAHLRTERSDQLGEASLLVKSFPEAKFIRAKDFGSRRSSVFTW